jgi:prepilin-type N-terminal cleavage/methylation domain-containing protein
LIGQTKPKTPLKGENAMQKKSGFTLVEIMIVVAIIGLLAAIAIPSFVKARAQSQKNECINNMRQIDSGKEQGALEQGISTGLVDVTIVNSFIKGANPTCPANGVYTYNVLGSEPTCTLVTEGHDLP